MIYLIFIIMGSFIIYYIGSYKTASVLERPSIMQVTFFRDYLLLTMIPYLYYFNNYNEHYILDALPDNSFILQAAIHAFIFIFIFIISFRVLNIFFNNKIKKIKIKVYNKKILLYISIMSIVFIFYFIIVSFVYSGGIIGLVKYNIIELNNLRAKLSQSSGFFLTINKMVIKDWIPMTSYLLFYMYLKKVEFNYFHKIIYYLMILLGILSSIWFFEKSVLFFYLLGFIGIYVYTGGKLNKKLVLLVPVLAIILVAFMYLITYQDKIVDSDYLITLLLHRATSQCVGSIMAIHYFLDNETLGISGISNLLASLSGEKFNSPYGLLIDYYIPETAEISGALSSFAVGEAFGLFGYPTVLFSGFIVAIYYSFFESTKNSCFTAYIFVGLYGIYFSHFFIAGGFYSFVWPIGLIYKIFPFLTIVLISSKYKRSI